MKITREALKNIVKETMIEESEYQEFFKRALEKNDIPFDPSLIYTCENVTFEEGLIFGNKILEEHPDVDGIFVITDLVAVGVLTYFNEKKINVPKDIAVIGFSNWFMSKVITPRLSSVDQPSYEMGIVSFNLLMEEMQCRKEDIPFSPKIMELKTQIIPRESSIKI